MVTMLLLWSRWGWSVGHYLNMERLLLPADVDVLVHGRGGIDGILQLLDEITKITEKAEESMGSNTQSAHETSRYFNDQSEFEALVQRVRSGDATVVLRKVFLCGESCNVEQEIWIKDLTNPLGTHDACKLYSILHVHHHLQVSSVHDVNPSTGALDVVDAMNARHLAAHRPESGQRICVQSGPKTCRF